MNNNRTRNTLISGVAIALLMVLLSQAYTNSRLKELENEISTLRASALITDSKIKALKPHELALPSLQSNVIPEELLAAEEQLAAQQQPEAEPANLAEAQQSPAASKTENDQRSLSIERNKAAETKYRDMNQSLEQSIKELTDKI